MNSKVEWARRFWAGEGRCVGSITQGATFRPRQNLSDAEQLDAWRRGLGEQARLPGLNVPSVYPDYGTVSVSDKVRLFLDRVSDFILSLWQWLRRESEERLCGNLWPCTFLPADLGLSMTEDMMPLLSPESYAEFGIPVLEKINRVAGGMQIHCCGEWGRHGPALARYRYWFAGGEDTPELRAFVAEIECGSESPFYSRISRTRGSRHQVSPAEEGLGINQSTKPRSSSGTVRLRQAIFVHASVTHPSEALLTSLMYL